MTLEETKQLEQLTLKKKREDKKIPTKKDIDRSYAEWQMFYLNNLNIFTEDYLEIPLHYFQHQILLDCWENDIEYIIASRGLSKSFTIGVLANDLALLLPGIQIGIASLTLGQSNKIINEKIDELLSSEKRGISPILKQLRRDGYIKFENDKTTDARVVSYGNGSKIFAVNCSETGRGSRTNISILDECVLVKRKDYDAIVEPMLEPYNVNGLYIEPKQIFMTSAKTKDKWVWKHLIKCVNGHYKDKNIKYGFFAGDIFTAVANKVQTKKQYLTRKENTNEFEFNQEFLNLWQGESEGSLFTFEQFHNQQVLDKAFYPRTPQQYVEGEPNEYDFRNENEIRWMANDIAVASGNDNDNSVIALGKIDSNDLIKKVEYITTKNGMNSLEQVVLIKRLFYEYKCSYYVMDSKGVGNVLFDLLTVPTEDLEYGITYPAWTVCKDKKLQISSDNVINDKIQRTLTNDAQEVIIPIAGTSEINSNMHLSLQKALKDKKIQFLQDDAEIEYKVQTDNPKWITLSAEKKADFLMPFLETRFTINESISLNTEYRGGLVKVKEDRSATKDRYMTLAMFNYFGDKLINTLLNDDYNEEVNLDDWQWLAE
jgi:hypothetical protein